MRRYLTLLLALFSQHAFSQLVRLAIPLVGIAVMLSCQARAAEPVMLLKKYFPTEDIAVHSRKYVGFNEEKSDFSKYNPVSLFFNGSMYIYQKTLSEQIAAQCTFTPSCSEFSKALIRRYGLFKGVFLTADRLMRCNGNAGEDYPPSFRDRHTGKLKDSLDLYQWRIEY